jgi:hypothetical protein
MGSREGTFKHRDLTVVQARTMRADHAMLTGFYADRVELARAAAQYGLMAYWADEYRRSTVRCRLLGEVIRGERSSVTELGRERKVEKGSTVVQLAAPRPAPDSPTTGEVA